MSIENQHAEPDFLKPPQPMTPERAEGFRKLAELSRQASSDPFSEMVRKWNDRAADFRIKADEMGASGRETVARTLRVIAITYENLARELVRAMAEKNG
jgi:hypothetical protein